MEESILKSTKKVLGLGPDYTPFDLDVITHINAAFSIVTQLGVGPLDGFMIEDDEAVWADFEMPQQQMNLLKTYVYLKVRILFDPPSTSFTTTALENQIKEQEWRLNNIREVALAVNLPPAIVPVFDEDAVVPDPDPELPQLDAPLNLTVTPNVDGNIFVQWDPTPNVQTFGLKRRVVGADSWSTTEYSATGDVQEGSFASVLGTEYEVYVYTLAENYLPGESSHYIVTGIGGEELPDLDIPGNFTLTPLNGSILAEWDLVPNALVYTLYHRTTASPDNSSWSTNGGGPTTDAIQFSSDEGVEYEAFVEASADGYNARTSDILTATGIVTPQLDLITDITVTAYSGYVQVTWTPPEHAEHIRVDYQSEAHGSHADTYDASDGTATFATEPDIDYEVRLVATADGYTLRVSDWYDVTGLDLPDLAPPVNAAVTPISGQMQITWEDTPNAEFVLIWFKEVGDLDFDVNGWGIGQHIVAQNSEVGVDYEYYLQSTADGYDPGESEHFFVTGIA